MEQGRLGEEDCREAVNNIIPNLLRYIGYPPSMSIHVTTIINKRLASIATRGRCVCHVTDELLLYWRRDGAAFIDLTLIYKTCRINPKSIKPYSSLYRSSIPSSSYHD